MGEGGMETTDLGPEGMETAGEFGILTRLVQFSHCQVGAGTIPQHSEVTHT